jgi:hypothetical protein
MKTAVCMYQASHCSFHEYGCMISSLTFLPNHIRVEGFLIFVRLYIFPVWVIIYRLGRHINVHGYTSICFKDMPVSW